MDGLSAKRVADVFAAFVDVLIPGDETYPAASAVGTQGLLLDRVRERLGHEAFPRVVDALGAEFASADSAAQIEAVQRLEEDQPDLFRFLRWATYFAYYERPPVIAVLRSLGHDYNDSPQPLGYPMSPFDPARHLPATPRGSYKKTTDVARVDLTALAGLGLPGQEV